MNLNELIKPYKRKLALDAFVRAISFGALLGVIATFIYALVLSVGVILCRLALELNWPIGKSFSQGFVDIIRDNWLPVAIVAGASLAIGLLICFILALTVYIDTYRKGVNHAIKTIDSLGLEERVVTMVEYQKDTSYVAKLQREDAQKHLKEFDSKNIIVKTPKKKLISIVSLFLAFTIMLSTVVGALRIPEFDGIYVNVNQWRDDLLAEWEGQKSILTSMADKLPEKEKEEVLGIIDGIDGLIKDVIKNKDLDKNQVEEQIKDIFEQAKEEIDRIIAETEDEKVKEDLGGIKDGLDDAKDEMEDVIEDSKDPAEKDEEVMDEVKDELDKSEIDEEKKEEIKEEIKDLENKFEEIEKDETLTDEEKEELKKEEAKETLEKFEVMLEVEKEHVKAFIAALRAIELTKPLGDSLDNLYDAVIEKADDIIKDAAKEEIIEAMKQLEYKIQDGVRSPYDLSKELAGIEDAFKENGAWLTGEALIAKIDTLLITFGMYAEGSDEGEYKDAYVQLVIGFENAKAEAENGNDQAAVDAIVSALEVARQNKTLSLDELIGAVTTAIENAKAEIASKNKDTEEESEEPKKEIVSDLEKALVSFKTKLEELKGIVNDPNVLTDDREAKITEVFDNSAKEMIDAIMIIEKLQDFFDKATEDLEDRFDENLDDKIDMDDVEDTIDKIKDEIDKSEISDESKEDLKQEMDKIEDEIEDIFNDETLTDKEKEEAIKDKIDEAIKDLEDKVEAEKENLLSLIAALKKNELTKALAEAIEKLQAASKNENAEKIAEGEKAVEAAMNSIKEKILNADIVSGDVVKAINDAIALTKSEDEDKATVKSELERAISKFCANLEEIDKFETSDIKEWIAFADTKFAESTKEIIEAAKNVEKLDDLVDEIEKEFDDLIKDEEIEDTLDKEDIKDIMDKIEEEVDKSEISDDKKDEIKDELDKVEDEIKDIIGDDSMSDEEKNDAIDDKLDETIKDIEDKIEEEKKNLIALIAALREYDETKELGDALVILQTASKNKDEAKIKEGEKAVETAMNNLKEGYLNADIIISSITNAINGAIAQTKAPEEDPSIVKSDLERALKNFCANLEAIDEKSNTATGNELIIFTNEKFAESTKEIIKAAKVVASLEDLKDKIEDEFDNVVKDDNTEGSVDKGTVEDTMDKVEDDVENSEISDDKKDEIKDEMGNLEEDLKDIVNDNTMSDDEKNDAIKDKIDDTIKDFEDKIQEETQALISLIMALKKNETTKALGVALENLRNASKSKDDFKILECEAALKAEMNGLKFKILNYQLKERELIDAIRDAIAQTKPEDPEQVVRVSDLEKALNNFCANLEALEELNQTASGSEAITFANEKFDESTEELIKAAKVVEAMKDLQGEIEDEFENLTPDENNKNNNTNSGIDEDELDDTMDNIKDDIDDSQVSDETKDDIQNDMDKVEDDIRDIINDENMSNDEKKDAIEDIVDDANKDLDNRVDTELENLTTLIVALKNNEITKELALAIEALQRAAMAKDEEKIAAAEKGVEDAMNNLKAGIVKVESPIDPVSDDTTATAPTASQIIEAINGAILETKPEGADLEKATSELEKALKNFCSNLEAINEKLADETVTDEDAIAFVDEKFAKSTEEIIKAAKAVAALKDLADEIEKEFDDLIKDKEPTTGDINKDDVNNTTDNIKDDIDKSDVSDDQKDDLKNDIDKVKDDIKDIIKDDNMTPSEKDDAIKDVVNDAIKDLENEAQKAKEHMLLLIAALKTYDGIHADGVNQKINNLGIALESLYTASTAGDKDKTEIAEAAVKSAMEGLKDGVLNGSPSSTTLIGIIEIILLESRPEEDFDDPGKAISELEKALENFCSNLRDINAKNATTLVIDELFAFIDEKFAESTDEIIKAVKNAKSLQDLIDDIEKEYENMTGEDIETPNDKLPPEEDEVPEYEDKTTEDKVNDAFNDIKDTIDNSNMNQEDKDDLNQELGDLEGEVGDILDDENKSEDDKKQDINDALKDEQNKLDKEVADDNQSKEDISNRLENNQYQNSTDETEKEISDALKDLGEAIEKGDQEKLDEALGKLENIINGKDPETGENKKDPETGEDIELTPDQKQDIADKIGVEIENAANSSTTDSALKDSMKDFADNLYNNQENAENNDKTFEEQLGEAFDKVEEEITDSNAQTNTKQDVSDHLGDLREELVGTTQKEVEDLYEDLKNQVNEAPINPELKGEINKELDQLDKDLSQMIQDGASKSEIINRIESSKENINNMIQGGKDSFTENNKPENNENQPNQNQTQDAMDKVNGAIQDASNALDKDDQQGVQDAYDKVDGAFKDLEDQLKNPETGEWLKGDALKEQLGSMAEDFKNMADKLPDGELKDIYENLSNAFQGALDKAEKGDESGAIKDAQNALNGAQQKVDGMIGKLEDLKDLQNGMNDASQNAQDSIMGKPNGSQDSNSNDNQNNNQNSDSNSNQNSDSNSNQNSDSNSNQNSDSNSNQNSDSNSNQNSDSNNNQNTDSENSGQSKPTDPENPSGGGTSGPQDGVGTDTDVMDSFIPSLGMTMEEIIAEGLLDKLYDEQFLKDLSDEERRDIEYQLAILKGQI